MSFMPSMIVGSGLSVDIEGGTFSSAGPGGQVTSFTIGIDGNEESLENGDMPVAPTMVRPTLF